ncbi:hypothetical protein [Dactylosporangium sp. NPDC005555]
MGTLRWLVESRPTDTRYTVHVTNSIPHVGDVLANLQRNRRFIVSV